MANVSVFRVACWTCPQGFTSGSLYACFTGVWVLRTTSPQASTGETRPYIWHLTANQMSVAKFSLRLQGARKGSKLAIFGIFFYFFEYNRRIIPFRRKISFTKIKMSLRRIFSMFWILATTIFSRIIRNLCVNCLTIKLRRPKRNHI